MRNFILTCLCHVILFVALTTPAQARLTLGISPTAGLTDKGQTNLTRLEEELSRSFKEEVVIRTFGNDAELGNWLLRFQEIDAAIVSAEFVKKQPAGTLLILADLHGTDKQKRPLALVIRRNLSLARSSKIKELVLKVSSAGNGQIALKNLGLLGFTEPGTLPAPSTKKPLAATTKPITGQGDRETKLGRQTSATPSAQPDSTAAGSSGETSVIKTAKEIHSPPTKTALSEDVSAEVKPKSSQSPKIVIAEVVREKAEASAGLKEESKAEPLASSKEKAPTPPQEKLAPDKRRLVFVALLILLAITVKSALLIMRWKHKKKTPAPQQEAPTIEPLLIRDTATAQPPPLSSEIAFSEDPEALVIEAGKLGPGKVPTLLKRCADLPEPVILQVSKGPLEKWVYFAGGQVSGTSILVSGTEESGAWRDKLGNLLIREGLISEAEQDQGMALARQTPGLRFAEALLRLGLIELAKLRTTLTRQAKTTIYSLILFQEGRYQVVAGDGGLPPEESVALEVVNLLREASHHKAEWTGIRQALPHLNTVLNFSADGRSKLEKVTLSPQQKAILELVDGQRSINDLCSASAMLDYEIYRFLYMMVKAGVIE